MESCFMCAVAGDHCSLDELHCREKKGCWPSFSWSSPWAPLTSKPQSSSVCLHGGHQHTILFCGIYSGPGAVLATLQIKALSLCLRRLQPSGQRDILSSFKFKGFLSAKHSGHSGNETRESAKVFRESKLRIKKYTGIQ